MSSPRGSANSAPAPLEAQPIQKNYVSEILVKKYIGTQSEIGDYATQEVVHAKGVVQGPREFASASINMADLQMEQDLKKKRMGQAEP